MKIYYAHSKKEYGSPREGRDLIHLRLRFPNCEIICPNNDLGDLGSSKAYLDAVDKCRLIVVRQYKDYVGKGVFHEVARAISNQTQVWVIEEKEKRKFKFSSVSGLYRVSPGDIAVKYGKLIYKK